MQDISVDFDVFKAITNLRPTAAVTNNDVLRKLLNLPSTHKDSIAVAAEVSPYWKSEGVSFPIGTKLRHRYKGRDYFAEIVANGVAFDGTVYGGFSPAANAVTGTMNNGWMFWECQLPGEASWVKANQLRKR